MQNVAFIPVRGGSKSIPMKNVRAFCGKPLVYWVLKAAEECRYIERIFVSTDNETVKEIVQALDISKCEVIRRSDETASDTATTESAMLEFAASREFSSIALIQATSPFLKSSDLDRAYQTFLHENVDSVFSAVRQKRFLIEEDRNGYARSRDVDLTHRPRRQDWDGFLVETGAFWITSREALLRSGCRMSGKMKVIELPEESYHEIDTPEDWVVLETLFDYRRKANDQSCNT